MHRFTEIVAVLLVFAFIMGAVRLALWASSARGDVLRTGPDVDLMAACTKLSSDQDPLTCHDRIAKHADRRSRKFSKFQGRSINR